MTPDLLACETCGSKLAFPIPPAWGYREVQAAADKFAPQLEAVSKSAETGSFEYWKRPPS